MSIPLEIEAVPGGEGPATPAAIAAPGGPVGIRGAVSRILSSRHARADLALLGVTLVWGTTFPLMHESLLFVPPYRFLFWRFGLASLVLLALYGRRLLTVPRRLLLSAAGVGIILFVGYAAQIVALQYTTAARSGFLTGLAVVLVPFAALILLHQRPSAGALTGVALAAAGLFLLSWPGWEDVSATVLRGDAITLVCVVAYALQIVLVGSLAPRMEPLSLAIVQLSVVAVLCGLISLFEPAQTSTPDWVLGGAVFLGLAATAFAFAVQSKAQRFTPSVHVALIFATEPVFAALFSWLFTGELLTGRSLAGCGLILTGMLVAELRSS